MKICPSCSTEFEDKLNFCRHDGTALKPKVAGRLCPQCGKEVAEDKRFCRHCGASLEPPQSLQPTTRETLLVPRDEKTEESETEGDSLIHVAESLLEAGDYKEAISNLEAVLNKNPDDQEARLLHLLASVKLYNIYGYEKQIESIRELANLTEKERGLAREIFLVRSEEAEKRGKQEEAREYQRLATRVILGQPLIEQALEKKAEEPRAQRRDVKLFPRKKVEESVKSSPRPPVTFEKVNTSVREASGRKKRRVNRLFISFVLVLGLAGALIAGMLGYYAKKQGVEIKDLFGNKPEPKQPEKGTVTSGPLAVAQVLGAEELGFKVWSAGPLDPNRGESFISEQIKPQLVSLQQLYQRAVQQKPDLMGTVTLELTISPSGTVTKVQEIGSRIKEREFKRAVIEEAYKWRFPEASSGLVKVVYPLLFVPPGMDAATLIKWEQVVALPSTGPKEPDKAKEPRRLAGVARPPEPPEETVPGPSPPPVVAVAPPSPPVQQPQPAQPEPAQPPQVTEKVIEKVIEKKIILGPYEVLYPTSVYTEPREDSRRVARIETGTRVNVVDVQGDWLEIRSKHGRPPGFIKKDSAMPIGSSR